MTRAAPLGAITRLFRVALDRAAATGTGELTGFWPGEGAAGSSKDTRR